MCAFEGRSAHAPRRPRRTRRARALRSRQSAQRAVAAQRAAAARASQAARRRARARLPLNDRNRCVRLVLDSYIEGLVSSLRFGNDRESSEEPQDTCELFELSIVLYRDSSTAVGRACARALGCVPDRHDGPRLEYVSPTRVPFFKFFERHTTSFSMPPRSSLGARARSDARGDCGLRRTEFVCVSSDRLRAGARPRARRRRRSARALSRRPARVARVPSCSSRPTRALARRTRPAPASWRSKHCGLPE